MDYHTLREFADSWVLLAMFLFFVGVILFTFRPGSRRSAEDASKIPLKED
jgi:cytochrome c oxidase cbb3-type subunit 4